MLAFTRSQKIRRFWDWFLEHEAELFASVVPPEELQEPMSELLRRINGDLCWEFGPTIDQRRELVISADGIVKSFPALLEVVRSAPALHRWHIVPFRQRMPSYGDIAIEFKNRSVGANDIECVATPGAGRVNIDLYIQGCPVENAEEWLHIGFLMLDMALGEFDVATRMGEIKVIPFKCKAHHGQRFPFTQLPERFDALAAKQAPRPPGPN